SAEHYHLRLRPQKSHSGYFLRARQPGHPQVQNRQGHIPLLEVADHLPEAIGLQKSSRFQGAAKELNQSHAEYLLAVGNQDRTFELAADVLPHGASLVLSRRGVSRASHRPLHLKSLWHWRQ